MQCWASVQYLFPPIGKLTTKNHLRYYTMNSIHTNLPCFLLIKHSFIKSVTQRKTLNASWVRICFKWKEHAQLNPLVHVTLWKTLQLTQWNCWNRGTVPHLWWGSSCVVTFWADVIVWYLIGLYYVHEHVHRFIFPIGPKHSMSAFSLMIWKGMREQLVHFY